MTSKKALRSIATLLVIAFGLVTASASEIPAGTRVTVRLAQSLSSERSRTGDTFDASLVKDLVINGTTVAKAGAPVKGKVTYAQDSGPSLCSFICSPPPLLPPQLATRVAPVV